MKVTFDTNVDLDVLPAREPHLEAASKLLAPVDHGRIDGALAGAFTDDEDAVLHEAARAAGATVIVTRDRVGFAKSSIPAMSPQELLAVVAASQ